jgi:hypothetical protein
MSATLDEMVDSYLNRKPNDNIYTNIIAGHLSQMRLFGIRQGVEFYPIYDPDGQRRSKIKRLLDKCKLDLYLKNIWDNCLGRGSILFYLRPTLDFYELHWYTKNQFKIYYDRDNLTMKEVVITYPFREDGVIGIETMRWVRIIVTPEYIRQGIFDHDPSILSDDHRLYSLMPMQGEVEVKNTLGIIPCVVVDNDPSEIGARGQSDFEPIASQIEALNRVKGAVLSNIDFFSNPTLVTTRPAAQVIGPMSGETPQYRGIATSSGFQNPSQGIYSTRKYDYSTNSGGGNKSIRKIIGNVDAAERFGYISPDAVGGDQTNWLMREEEMIRTVLGGVAENSISAGATALEIKSLFGKAAATAKQKAQAIYTHGICAVLELMIRAEEFVWLEGFRAAVGWDETLQGPLTVEAVFRWRDGDETTKQKPNVIPEGLSGLFPSGDRSVFWRWTGPVFEDSPQDLQLKSILMRNLTEEGISTTEAFRVIYPDRNDAEIEIMLGGVPFRRAQRIIQLIQMMVPLQQTFMTVPLTNNPQVALGQIFGGEIDQIIARLVSKLAEELNKGEAQAIADYDEPDYSSDLLSFSGISGNDSTTGATGATRTTEPISAAWNGAGYPLSSTFAPGPSSGSTDYGPGSVSPVIAAGISPNQWLEWGYGNPDGVIPGNAQSAPGAGTDSSSSASSGSSNSESRGINQFRGGLAGGVRALSGYPGYSGMGTIADRQFDTSSYSTFIPNQYPLPGQSTVPELLAPLPAPGATLSRGTGQQLWRKLFPSFSAPFTRKR